MAVDFSRHGNSLSKQLCYECDNLLRSTNHCLGDLTLAMLTFSSGRRHFKNFPYVSTKSETDILFKPPPQLGELDEMSKKNHTLPRLPTACTILNRCV